jgi:hypothetical protein
MEEFEPTVAEYFYAKGIITSILHVLTIRFGKIDKSIESKLSKIYDFDLLATISDKSIDLNSINEFKSYLRKTLK